MAFMLRKMELLEGFDVKSNLSWFVEDYYSEDCEENKLSGPSMDEGVQLGFCIKPGKIYW